MSGIKQTIDIDFYNKLLDDKCKTGDYILFQTKIPNSDFHNELELIVGKNSSVYVLVSNYFLTYGILHELLQIYNNIKKETFDYFCQNIFNRKEASISELKKIISKKENIKLENIIGFDFSYPDFFLNNSKKYNRGSDITNFSSCYNNINIPLKILNVFLLKDIHKNNVIIIKVPNITSVAIIDFLKILSYVFSDIYLIKLVQDSFFKDSFHIILSNPNIKQYNQIKDELKNKFKKQNITNLDGYFLKSILKHNDEKSGEFIIKIKEFATVLELLIATYMLNIINALQKSSKNSYRDSQDWKYLDFYFSKCN